MWHQRITDRANELDWIIRTPTYTTTASTDLDAHTSPVVAIRVLSKVEAAPVNGGHNKFVPVQVITVLLTATFNIYSP